MGDAESIDEDLERYLAVPSDESRGGSATPVTVLTGFLGAGKTTLANRILAEDHGLRIAVLVNDFGEVNIDSELIVGVAERTVSLANGCVCCEVRDDLIGAIDSVLGSDSEVDAIMLEASGVAEPMSIARTFLSPGYQHALRLDGIIAVVDAEQLPAQVADPVTGDLVYGQIGFADLVVLNKVDLADRDRLETVRRFVLAKLPSVRIIEAVKGDVPLSVLVGVRDVAIDLPPGSEDPDGHGDDHEHGFVSWVYRRNGCFDVEALKAAVGGLPGSVLRVKGFVHAHDHPASRVLLQAVGMRVDSESHDEWGERNRSTTLLVIGSEAMDQGDIELALDDCLV